MNSRMPQGLLSGADRAVNPPRQQFTVKFINCLGVNIREIRMIVDLAGRYFIRAITQQQTNTASGQKAPALELGVDTETELFTIEGDGTPAHNSTGAPTGQCACGFGRETPAMTKNACDAVVAAFLEVNYV